MEIKTEKEFNDLIITKDKFVVIDFYATWCGPCKIFAPIFENVAKLNENKAMFGRIDADSDDLKMIADKYNISCYPTIIFFLNGEIKHRNEGISGGTWFKKLVDEKLSIKK